MAFRRPTYGSWEPPPSDMVTEMLWGDDDQDEQAKKPYHFHERKELFTVDLNRGQNRERLVQSFFSSTGH